MEFIKSFSAKVKIYLYLNEKWTENVTGICTIEDYDELSTKLVIVVRSENGDILLTSKIISFDSYSKDQDSLLIWFEPSMNQSVCLSFQEEKLREQCLQCIFVANKYSEMETALKDFELYNEPPILTPEISNPRLRNLSQIIKQLDEFAHKSQTIREKFIGQLIKDKFLNKLNLPYEEAFDLEDTESLVQLFNIIRTLINFYDNRILESMSHEDTILTVASIMENNPDNKNGEHSYRNFLEDPTNFKQFIELPDEFTKRKVHESFHLTYLRDTILSRIITDDLSNRITMLIVQKNNEVVKSIGENLPYLGRIFGTLQDPESPISHKRSIVLFIQQLYTIGKSSQSGVFSQLVKALFQKGTFPLLRFTMDDTDLGIRVAGAEIFAAMVDHDQIEARSTIEPRLNSNVTPLFDLLIKSMIQETSTSVISQYSDIIKALLIHQAPLTMGRGGNALTNTSVNNNQLNEKSERGLLSLITYFYNNLIAILVSPITELENKLLKYDINEEIVLPRHLDTLVLTVCDLLNSFLRSHSLKIKGYIISSKIVTHIVKLLKVRAGHVKLAAIRFFRSLIGTKEEFYLRIIIKHKVLECIFNTYISTNNSNNMLNSACLEFFEFIKSQNLSILIEYLSTILEEQIKSRTEVNTFQEILFLYSRTLLNTPDTASIQSASPKTEEINPKSPKNQPGNWNSKTLEKAEEDYFDGEDDDMENNDQNPLVQSDMGEVPTILPMRKSLVDYEDDEDVFDDLVNNSNKPTLDQKSQSSSKPLPKEAKKFNITFSSSMKAKEENSIVSPKINPLESENSKEDPLLKDSTPNQTEEILQHEKEESHGHLEDLLNGSNYNSRGSSPSRNKRSNEIDEVTREKKIQALDANKILNELGTSNDENRLNVIANSNTESESNGNVNGTKGNNDVKVNGLGHRHNNFENKTNDGNLNCISLREESSVASDSS